jgi:hypothetical protein
VLARHLTTGPLSRDDIVEVVDDVVLPALSR